MRFAVDLDGVAARRHLEELGRGGLYLPGCAGEPGTECIVELTKGADRLELAARIVLAEPAGIGLALDIPEEWRAWFAAKAASAVAGPAESTQEAPALADDALADDALADDALADDALADDAPTRNVYERVRGLSLVEQHRLARAGELAERIALERIYGKTVWEQLLRNARISPPEVARIARMGALPRPLLELIVGNATWLGVPEVRRALMTNPRLTPDMIPRILRQLPKHELKLVPTTIAYTTAVRDAARRMLKAIE